MKRKPVLTGANCGHPEAGGSGDAGGRADPAGGDQRTDVRSLVAGISLTEGLSSRPFIVSLSVPSGRMACMTKRERLCQLRQVNTRRCREGLPSSKSSSQPLGFSLV